MEEHAAAELLLERLADQVDRTLPVSSQRGHASAAVAREGSAAGGKPGIHAVCFVLVACANRDRPQCGVGFDAGTVHRNHVLVARPGLVPPPGVVEDAEATFPTRIVVPG